jgi:hypothetical protein
MNRQSTCHYLLKRKKTLHVSLSTLILTINGRVTQVSSHWCLLLTTA